MDTEQLLWRVMQDAVPDGVNVMFSPDADELDWMSLPSENYPIVVLTILDDTDIPNGSPADGNILDVVITTLDCNRVDEPSSHENSSTLSDIVLEQLFSFARTQRGAPGVGKILAVEKTSGAKRIFTWEAGGGQRTQFDSRFKVTTRPSHKAPINS
jgi:hypothetical protein